MKANFFFSIGFDVLCFLSLFFFLISTPHLTAPLGLFFMLSVATQFTFIGTGFGIAVITFAVSMFLKNMWLKSCLMLVYCIAAFICIISIMLAKIEMFVVPASLISVIVFFVLHIAMAIKWGSNFFALYKIKPLNYIA